MNVRHLLRSKLFTLMGATALCGCSLMTVDQSDCPDGLYVNFVYDYNTQRADMFKDHVGCIELYVFDEDERLVTRKTASGSQLSTYGFTIHVPEAELAPGHRYTLMALGLQREWSTAMLTSGAKYRRTDLQTGDSRNQMVINLDHGTTRAGGIVYPVDNSAPLDTLWHTLAMMTGPAERTAHSRYIESVELTHGEPAYVTMSMVRDTKHLNISLREIDHPERVNHEDYDVFILDANATLDSRNNLIQRQDTLLYRPYASWTTSYTALDGSAAETQPLAVEERSAHYDLMFNRLMHSTTPSDCAVLCIRRKATGEDIAVLNLPEVLSQGRTAYEIYNYTPQEYLDREYDYRLELFLKGEEWQQLAYLYVCIDVLSWARRIQYVEF